MTIIKTTIKDRRLELDAPPDWPDGTEVEVCPIGPAANGDADMMPAEEIAKTLVAMDRMEPLEMTDAEWAAWEAERQARSQREKAAFAEHAESLRRAWN